jgi:gamma-glutamylcyclotransferase (GGCT)/AIG2-like uncharacterized protein YtfP
MKHPETGYLFVYGTLKRGQSAYCLLKPEARFICTGVMRGRLYDQGFYPVALAATEPDQEFAGEVYELSDPPSLLEALDRYEGVGAQSAGSEGYFRTQADVLGCNGNTYRAWVYLFAGRVGGSRRIFEWPPEGDRPDWRPDQTKSSRNEAAEEMKQTHPEH